jgi:hypothetical protein
MLNPAENTGLTNKLALRFSVPLMAMSGPARREVQSAGQGNLSSRQFAVPMYNSELGDEMLKVTLPTVWVALAPPGTSPISGNWPVVLVAPVAERNAALLVKVVIAASAGMVKMSVR